LGADAAVFAVAKGALKTGAATGRRMPKKAAG